MPTVLVPTAYRGPTRGQAQVEVEGATVRACIEAVELQFPGFNEQVFDAGGAVHRFVKLFVNEEAIDNADVDREVEPGDRVEILAAIAGG
jgi:molybdopterin converting factor small subunit